MSISQDFKKFLTFFANKKEENKNISQKYKR